MKNFTKCTSKFIFCFLTEFMKFITWLNTSNALNRLLNIQLDYIRLCFNGLNFMTKKSELKVFFFLNQNKKNVLNLILFIFFCKQNLNSILTQPLMVVALREVIITCYSFKAYIYLFDTLMTQSSKIKIFLSFDKTKAHHYKTTQL